MLEVIHLRGQKKFPEAGAVAWSPIRRVDRLQSSLGQELCLDRSFHRDEHQPNKQRSQNRVRGRRNKIEG